MHTKASTPIVQHVHKFMALVALICTLMAGLYLPVNTVLLSVSLFAVFALTSRLPYIWLALLLPITLLYQTAPEHGRFIVNELDLILLASLSGAWFVSSASDNHQPQFANNVIRWLPVLAFTVLWFSHDFSSSLPELLQAAKQNPYYNASYGFKVGKGALLGLFAAAILYRQWQQSAEQVMRHLCLGGVVSAFCLMLIILWERGSFAQLTVNHSLGGFILSVFDFASRYRVTGLIADMHTGGESIDGFFITVLVLCLTAVFYFKKPWAVGCALLATLAIVYCILVGFTRATYGAAFAVIVYSVYRFMGKKGRDIKYGKVGVLAVLSIFCLLIILTKTGFTGAFAGFVMLVAPLLFKYFRQLKKFKLATLIAINGVAILFTLYLHFSSRWIASSVSGAITLIIFGVALAFIAYYFDRAINQDDDQPNYRQQGFYLTLQTIICISAAILFVATSGSRMTERFSTVSADIDHRLEHWSQVVASGHWGIKELMVGHPTGAFPINYLMNYPDTVSRVGSFGIDRETGALQFGGGLDLKVGQRIKISKGVDYQLIVRVKNDDDVKLAVAACRRNIIVQQRYNSSCTYQRMKVAASDEYVNYSHAFRLEDNNRFADKPTLFFIKNYNRGSIVNISEISLLAPDGTNLITNSDFEQGLDHWFFYNDFEHLPWHIKNIFVELLYNTGIIGSLLMLLLCIRVFSAKLVDESSEKAPLQLMVASLVIGWFLLGFFGSPLDSANASWLFFTLLFGGGMILKSTTLTNKN